MPLQISYVYEICKIGVDRLFLLFKKIESYTLSRKPYITRERGQEDSILDRTLNSHGVLKYENLKPGQQAKQPIGLLANVYLGAVCAAEPAHATTTQKI